MMASGVMTRAHTAQDSTLPFLGATGAVAVAVAAPGISTNFDQPFFVLGSVVAIPLLVATWLLFTRPPRGLPNVFIRSKLPIILLLIYGAFELIRGSLGGDPVVATLSSRTGIVVLSQCLLAVATTICVSFCEADDRYRLITAALFYSFLTSCVIQTVADLTGAFDVITNQTAASSTPSSSLALIGIHRHRMQMIFASGLNASAVYPLVLLLGCFFHKQGPTILRIIGCALAAYLLLSIDSRAAILAPIAAIALLSTLEKSPRLISTAYVTMPLWPIILIFVISWLPAGIHDFLSSRYASYGMFSGREFIWRTSLDRISNAPFGTIFVGYGLYGHLSSSAEGFYAHLFAYYNQRVQTVYSMHNTFVQTLFDGGILGVFTLAWAARTTLETLGYNSRGNTQKASAARLLVAVMITYLIVGMTEVAFTPYLREAYGLLLVVMLLAAAVFPGSQREAEQQHVRRHGRPSGPDSLRTRVRSA